MHACTNFILDKYKILIGNTNQNIKTSSDPSPSTNTSARASSSTQPTLLRQRLHQAQKLMQKDNITGFQKNNISIVRIFCFLFGKPTNKLLKVDGPSSLVSSEKMEGMESGPWYKEVQELRKVANDYKV